ncbi:helix-turn-helix domain-containing protein [Haloferax sp. Atlit-4N]|uniref:helix-turn-helix domain-containing protein n=1 Tax=Haloferax sp. Atlit-4N TaxID=2077206 RepID=UPI000E22312F
MSRDKNSGRYSSTVSDSEILEFFRQGKRPFWGTGEIAEQFEWDHSNAHRRLEALSRESELQKIKVGSRNVVWWLPR